MSSPPAAVELVPGYTISPLINGCWQLTPDHGGGPASRHALFDHFNDLLAHGFTTFDCADIYTGVEETLGAYRRTLDDPQAIQVHTKYVPDRGSLRQLTPAQVDAAIDRSRKRLGMDRLDLVQFHWWRYEVPGIDMVLDRLCEAQAAGRIRVIGTTNFDTAHVRGMLERGAPVASLQTQFSLLDRRPQRRMTALCAEHGVTMLPYGTLAGGFLSERWLGAVAPEALANRSLTKYRLIIDEAGGWAHYQELLRALARIARRHDVGIDTVAARWVLDQPGVAAIILGTGSRSRAARNLAVTTLQLDSFDLEVLTEALAKLAIPPGDMYELERDPDGVHSRIIKTDLNTAGSP